ncbi:MAG: hypothetical protein QXL08_08495 [Candidatus Nezhaarchaeales archaeon]
MRDPKHSSDPRSWITWIEREVRVNGLVIGLEPCLSRFKGVE